MDIPQISTDSIRIRDLDIGPINIWTAPEARIPGVPPIYPVTNLIGVPVVDMPGCVEAHERNDNNQLEVDDPKGVKVYCDAGTPSFNPMDYNRSKLKLERETPVPPIGAPPDKKAPEAEAPPAKTPDTSGAASATVECPTQKQLSEEPVGFIFDSGRKEVTGYKLVGNQCIREVRDVPIVEQAINGLPPTGTVITTGGIAVVATTSALLAKPFADILLKVIKPTVKKVLKKVAAIRGKKLKVQSVEDRRAEQRDRNQAIAKLRSVKAKTKK
ncbi:hypothetical protein S170810_205 [Synechococcus phage S-CAM1]|uniref:Gp164 n=1 Tax=Synechococcus phage S-CAM1 TaxID=754037 RepID=A0A1D8KHV0_9CAUD|nr:hypothetical protein S170810_205 [Synechococcus phage S-CAM1]